MENIKVYEDDAAIIVDQLLNNEDASDQEIIDHLHENTMVPYEILAKLVACERTNFLCDPFMTFDDFDWAKYGLELA